MIRWTVSALAALLLVVGALVVPPLVGSLGGGGSSFPDPVDGRAVYDPAGAVSPAVEEALEARIDETEARSGAEIVLYLRVDASADDASNLADARALIDRWGIGRAGFDDGFVMLLSFDDATFQHGTLSTYAGGGFKAVYLPEGDQTVLREQVLIPAIRQGALEGGLIAAVEAIGAAITPQATGRLELFRVVNAMLGIPGGILVLLLTLGMAYTSWRRYGDDPELTDSPSILMAGPPAGMTAPLATVIRDGRATGHSVNTTLVELASRGLISFRNLDRVKEARSDDDPDPLSDPAVEVLQPQPTSGRLAGPQTAAYETIRGEALGGVLARERLWGLNEALSPVKGQLEEEAVRLGWLTRRPTPMIVRWLVIGAVEVVLGIGLAWLGYAIPMSGLTLLGAALGVGGIGTLALGSAMSQRTPQGAYLDAMLKAYCRTLKKTLELARGMDEVVAQPEVAALADTPDKAVLWGIALGLQREVAAVLERGLADPRAQADPATAYYPAWLGTSSSGSLASAGGGGGGAGLAGLFSGSGTPDIGGMFGALGSIGSSPASSSSGSGGGGFGGGSSSGGGGGSSSF